MTPLQQQEPLEVYTSSEKLYQELGLESLQQRRWYRKLCPFLKIIKEKSPDYLFNIIPKNNSNHRTRNSYNIPQFDLKHNFSINSFFPLVYNSRMEQTQLRHSESK